MIDHTSNYSNKQIAIGLLFKLQERFNGKTWGAGGKASSGVEKSSGTEKLSGVEKSSGTEKLSGVEKSCGV
jgi:hypothetical protein